MVQLVVTDGIDYRRIVTPKLGALLKYHLLND